MCPTELLAYWLQIHREFVEPLVVVGFFVLRSLAESNTFTKRLLNLRDFSSLCQKSFAKKCGNGTAAEGMQKFFKNGDATRAFRLIEPAFYKIQTIAMILRQTL